jgi:hypothetical protein
VNAGECRCGCGASLAGLRSDAVYASEACSKRARRAASPDKARTLEDVRGRGEESKEKSRYTLIAREHITHTLLATGYFSAEDFDSLGIPPAHVNVCTSWIGHFSKRKVMEPISWRYSSKPSRKGGKVWTYKITQKGREVLPALLEETRAEIAGMSAGNHQVGASSAASAPPGEELSTDAPGSPARQVGSASAPSPGVGAEPARLFSDEAPSAYDPWESGAAA